ncbi:MAG: AmmeMemoRadiSam system protein B [Promethearchaeota archaeon]
MRIRRSVRAGSWYSGSKEALLREIKAMYEHEVGPGLEPPAVEQRSNEKKILGVISPHAGYSCSAPTATHGFLALAKDRQNLDTVLLLGNRHSWGGPEVSVADHDAWETPLGTVQVNKTFVNKIDLEKKQLEEGSKLIELDTTAHADEHSIELQLPFLQHLYSDFQIVPIAIGNLPVRHTITLGKFFADLIISEGLEETTVAVASTDMTHGNMYNLNHQEVSRRDQFAIEAIIQRDPAALEAAVKKHDISMCGEGPTKVLLSLTEKLGAKSAKLLNYATSGQTCGPMSAVVGYASVVIRKD